MPQLSFIPSAEVGDLADDVRQIFEELATTLKAEQRATSGECRPPLDVFESDDALEVVVDLSGVAPDAVRVLYRASVLVIAGEKGAPRARSPQAFHLVEREFGRFARGVRVNGAFDLQRASATMRDGELTVVLPKRADRRGAAHRIRITSDTRHA
jgi:HSP20 family protein